jgi:hypothetical protein
MSRPFVIPFGTLQIGLTKQEPTYECQNQASDVNTNTPLISTELDELMIWGGLRRLLRIQIHLRQSRLVLQNKGLRWPVLIKID